MSDTAGESSARVTGEAPDRAPTPPEGEPAVAGSSSAEPAPSSGSAPSSDAAAPAAEATPSGPRPTGVRWDDRGSAPLGADDATPPSGVATPGPGDVVPTRTSGVGPVPSPGAAWPDPAFQPGQQTAPGWAPPPSASSSRDPARRRRVRRIVLAGVLGLVVLAAVVVALLAFLVGPRFARYDVLDRAAVERGVTDVVTRDWKRQVGGVSCPDDERVRPGTTFSCTGTVDGKPARIPVDVVDDSGTYEVGQPR